VDIQSAQIFNGSVIEASTLQLHSVRNIRFVQRIHPMLSFKDVNS
jgi:hypothetical protein